MGKFVKGFKAFVKERKENAINLAGSTTFMTHEKRYKVFFVGINGFISGHPSKQEELAFSNLWKFPAYGIDTKYNKPARTRCKHISKRYRKEKVVGAEDILFLENEVKPYFVKSYEEQSGKLFETLGKITDAEAKEAFGLFKKNERNIKGKM